MNINELPPELLVRIFSNIDDFTQKIALERVCRHWRQTVSVNWNATRTCPVPLDNKETFGLVLNRCGEWLEELWLQYVQIDENMVNQMARRMQSLKYLKLSLCELDGPAVDSITDLFGQQLYSFILDGTPYHPNMRRLLENESSKLEHLKIYLYRPYSIGTLPTKLPSNLKFFYLRTLDIHTDSSNFLSIIARDCKNLKIFHWQIETLLANMIFAIGNIKSLVYLNLYVASIVNEDALQNVISHELPNLKALNIGGYGYCSEEMISNISRNRPDLVYLNVFARHPFQIPESLHSLTLGISTTVNSGQFLPGLLFEEPNKSIQHLDIRSHVLPSYSNFNKKLLGKFPNLKSIHCKMPNTVAEFDSIISMKDHMKKGRNITIYFHHDGALNYYYKYVLPDDLPQYKIGWTPTWYSGKCENLVLKKLIKEAIEGGNEPSFLEDWWME